MSKSFQTAIAAAAMLLATAANAATMTVIKSPSCGCCAKWVEHVRANGFTVKVVNVEDIMGAKAKAGVPDRLASCHTAFIGGYVIEGHVPASDIKKLLTAMPKAKGVAVAGMPMGSPGMEQGSRHDSYQTILFTATGKTTVFARH